TVFPPMIRSMTGFGRAEASTDLCTITVEARSVNHRHLDLAIRMPRALAGLEPRVRRALSQTLERGRVDLNVQLGPGAGNSLQRAAVDEARILTEVAVWAEKSDVTEELARLRSHLDQLGLLLDKGGPMGRPLDFLLQELNREVNTVASKADDLELSQTTLAAK